MDTLRQDIRYALRTLSRTPGFTLAAALTLALAIGANTVLFSAIHAVLMRPLPFPRAESLVRIWDTQEAIERASVSQPELLGWREQTHAFSQLAAFDHVDYNRQGIDTPERVRGGRVTTNFFTLLAVTPSLGRDFTEEDAPAAAPSSRVMISHGFWKRAMNAAPDVVGQTLVLDGRSHTVVGVLPESFSFPEYTEDVDVWVPQWMDPQRHGMHHLAVLGRLAPGRTVETASAELARVAGPISHVNAGEKPHGVRVVSWRESLVEGTRPVLWTLWAAVGFVLLIACANVANLMLVRALGRQRDGAIRAALGAPRARQVQQALVESVLLALLGGAVGMLLVLWGLELVRTLLPPNMIRMAPMELSGTALLFSFGLSVGTGVLFGLAPALYMSTVDAMGVLRGSSRSVSGTSNPLRSGLVAVQLALALVLLVGTVLMVRTLDNVQHVDLGFDPHGVLTVRLSQPLSQSPEDLTRRAALFEQMRQRLATLPGVEAAGFVNDAPLGGSNSNGDFVIDGRGAPPEGQRWLTELRVATPDYFRAMRIALRSGRTFESGDISSSAPVVIINESFARRYFPGEEPLGKRIRVDWTDAEPYREIIGVVGDVRHERLTEPAKPESYVPLTQFPWPTMTLVLRTRGEPTTMLSSVRNEVRAVDSTLPVQDLRPFDSRLENELRRPMAVTRLLGCFALLALVLAGVGVYGVMAYAVSQRTRELGIRLALGEHPSSVLRLVLGQGMRLTLVGVAVGVVAALACTRLMASMLYGVNANEPFILGGVALTLAFVALLASGVPAWRASRVPPTVALRAE
ncbi:ABC transporter permease [Myxococcaceae bacterium JPH2]|nr:ABC transporter permease [Myxococcaceae bacterium JPH2]